MEDELDQEGMEEEISPSKAGGKGSPMKMIIILVAVVVIGAVAAFGILTVFFPDETENGEAEQEEVVIAPELTEYGVEFPIDPTITISVKDERNRVRNLVIDITFETSNSGAAELSRRLGQIRNVIVRTIRSFKFEVILDQVTQDSMVTIIQRELNMRLPLEPQDKIISTSLNIITQ